MFVSVYLDKYKILDIHQIMNSLKANSSCFQHNHKGYGCRVTVVIPSQSDSVSDTTFPGYTRIIDLKVTSLKTGHHAIIRIYQSSRTYSMIAISTFHSKPYDLENDILRLQYLIRICVDWLIR